MRLLIFGPGVIGSLYASLFAEAGFDTAGLCKRSQTGNTQEEGSALFEKRKSYKYN